MRKKIEIKHMNKKGALTDIFIFLAIAFVLALVSVVFVFIGNTTYNELQKKAPFLQEIVEGSGENASEIIDKTFGQVVVAYSSLKWITFMLMIGMIMSMVVTSFLVRVHPVFFVPYVIISVIAVIVSVPMSNAYETIYNNPTLASSFQGFWGQTFIFANLHIWVTVIVFLVGTVLFVNMLKYREYGIYGA